MIDYGKDHFIYGIAAELYWPMERSMENTEELVCNHTILSKEECIKRSKAFFPRLENIEINQAMLYTQLSDYIWTLFVSDGSSDIELRCDARTGEPVYYFCNLYEVDLYSRGVYKDPREEVISFLKKITPNEFIQCKKYNDDAELCGFHFGRMKEGIPVASDRIVVYHLNNEIERYEKRWFAGEIPSMREIISLDALYDKLEIKLYYIPIEKDYWIPAYIYEAKYALFDPVTGVEVWTKQE